MAGPAGGDLPWLAIGVAARVDESASAKAEPAQVSADGTPVDPDVQLGELVGNALGGPLVLSPPDLDLLDDTGCCRGTAVVGRRSTVLEPGFAERVKNSV
jgi:hypothetical protein